jgi:glycosyl transferase family 25
MGSINHFIDSVYVINMDKDTKRLYEINASLKAAGIRYERFPAIDGSRIETHPQIAPICAKFCTNGMKGCALSHHAVWKKAIEDGDQTVMVMEDDAIIPEDINERIADVFARIPYEWDILYVGCRYTCNDKESVAKVGNYIFGTTPEQYDREIKKVKGSIGSHAIIYKTEFLKKIINELIYTHIDAQLILWGKEFKANAYGLYPDLVKVDETKTESNLSDAFPPLLVTGLNKIELVNGIPLGWLLSESSFKIIGLNVNTLSILFILLIIFLPWPAVGFILAWLFIEYIASGRDFKGVSRFILFAGFALLIRHCASSIRNGV